MCNHAPPHLRPPFGRGRRNFQSRLMWNQKRKTSEVKLEARAEKTRPRTKFEANQGWRRRNFGMSASHPLVQYVHPFIQGLRCYCSCAHKLLLYVSAWVLQCATRVNVEREDRFELLIYIVCWLLNIYACSSPKYKLTWCSWPLIQVICVHVLAIVVHVRVCFVWRTFAPGVYVV